MPTHYCNDCGALWAHVTAEDHPGLPPVLSDGYLSSRSAEWCPVCEAATLGDLAEIPSAVVKGMAPAVERIAELERVVAQHEADQRAALETDHALLVDVPEPGSDEAKMLRVIRIQQEKLSPDTLARRDARVAAKTLRDFAESLRKAQKSSPRTVSLIPPQSWRRQLRTLNLKQTASAAKPK